MYRVGVPPGGQPQNANVTAVLVNCRGNITAKGPVRPVLYASITDKGFDPTSVFNAADHISLWMGVQRFAGTLEESRLFKSMPIINKIFTQIANHHPPLQYDDHEIHGNSLRARLDGRTAFEMNVESNGGIQFRAWNNDNSINCEMKTSPSKVEWMKVFHNHQVAFEANNRLLP